MADNVILTFPPRPVSRWERTLLAEWLTAAQRAGFDVSRAYVSERRGDDPRFVGRIVVMLRSSKEPAYLLYPPTASTIWVVMAAPTWEVMQRFRTLRAALNSIRPVLGGPEAAHSGSFFTDFI
jgi:hypothetical protein